MVERLLVVSLHPACRWPRHRGTAALWGPSTGNGQRWLQAPLARIHLARRPARSVVILEFRRRALLIEVLLGR